MSKFWTGVGSRETPKDIMELMTNISYKLGKNSWILRSGGANGADNAFEKGAWETFTEERPEIYIPWDGFNQRTESMGYIVAENLPVWEESKKIASLIHPNWSACSNGAKSLHARNIMQVLGHDLRTPSKFLICWAKPDKYGDATGGTRTAWMLAKGHGIKRFNLFFNEDYDRIINWINS